MKALVIYDSKFGNTEMVALAIAEAINGQVLHVSEVNPDSVMGIELLIIGSPTHGGFPTEGIHVLTKEGIIFKGKKVAAFDTRTRTTIFGYAAPKIARNIKKSRGKLLAPPEGFFVLGTEGPLMDGEIDRAISWAKEIIG